LHPFPAVLVKGSRTRARLIEHYHPDRLCLSLIVSKENDDPPWPKPGATEFRIQAAEVKFSHSDQRPPSGGLFVLAV